MGLSTWKSSTAVGILWLALSTKKGSVSAHRQTHPNQVTFVCASGSHFSPLHVHPIPELFCLPSCSLGSLRSMSEPWMLCYKGAAFVFPPEHQVLLAVTVLHPNFADVLKHFWVLVTVQKGRVVWYFSTLMNKIMCSGTVEGAGRQDGFRWGRKRWLGWEIRGWDGACHSLVSLLPMERFLGQLLGFGSSKRMEPNPKVRWGANE